MFDPMGMMPEADVNECVDFINKKAVSPNDSCIVCGDPNNSVSQYLWRVMTIPQSSNRFMPMVMTHCNNCGFLRFFSAMQLGVYPAPIEVQQELPLPTALDREDGVGETR